MMYPTAEEIDSALEKQLKELPGLRAPWLQETITIYGLGSLDHPEELGHILQEIFLIGYLAHQLGWKISQPDPRNN